MKKIVLAALPSALMLITAGPALAHVTIQPTEARGESFSAFVVRVPNERDNADTTRVEVRFPPLASVSFQDVPGWERTVRMQQLDEPIEAFGEEVTEAVGRVTWTGGAVAPHEYVEFPFSALTPPGEEELEFPAIQTYSNGEVVRWIGPEEADAPAARVHTIELGELGEGVGDLGALHDAVHEIEELSAQIEELSANSNDEQPAAAPAEDGDDSNSDMALVLGGIGAGLGAIALVVSLMKKRA